jgi:hypothetical protein
MPEHLTDGQVERYQRRVMSPAELLETGEHLIECEVCSRQLRRKRQTDSAFAFLRADFEAHASAPSEHLQYEQIAGFADGTLDETEHEIVISHLDFCSACREDIRHLSQFKASLAAPTELGRTSATPPTWRERMAALWRSPVGWSPLRLAGMTAFALLLVAAAAVAWFTWKQISSPRTDMARSGATPPVLEPTRSPAESSTVESEKLQGDANTVGSDEPAQPHPTPEATPEILLALDDGGRRITLDKQGQVKGLEALSPSDQRAVKEALTSQRVDRSPALAELRGRAETFLGESGEGSAFALSGPVGVVVATDRPTFRWRALGGASSYVVTVYDSGLNELAASPPLSGTQWKASSALSRGGVYIWQVTATKDEQKIVSPVAPAPEAKFKVLGHAELAELERARRKHPNSHLLLGTLYARAGLLDDAAREFQALLKANPSSAVARKLLRSVKAR